MSNFLFSIITPIYKTPINKLERLYLSLVNQTYSNWEWVVFDDSPTEHRESDDYIKNLSKKDERVKLYSDNQNNGIIGNVKKKAFFLGKGDVLVEVDHDDELIDTCLENLLVAYKYSSDIGFVYGHACEIYEDKENILDYGDDWGMGYGGYAFSEYKGFTYKVAIVGNVNPRTVRHITGIPNHVRTWRKDIYHKLGGHNETLNVADDFELFLRTFLITKVAKINVFTYIQYFERDGSNAQFSRNSEIHRLGPQILNYYNDAIHSRLLELGIDDYIWENGELNFNLEKPMIEEYANIIIPEKLLKNNLIKMKDPKKLYGYSRVYNIEPTLKFKQTEHYSSFIKWLVRFTNCRNYLELGVEYGLNIQEIKTLVDLCVGVDINDIQDKEGIDFYQMTTDEFFKKNKKNFDIIFIDANHKFEQVQKDFDNSLKILNKFGIIILHDTDPIIEELMGDSYCSDSYKIVDYISKKKNLNIITLPIQETGMTLVMRKSDRRVFEH